MHTLDNICKVRDIFAEGDEKKIRNICRNNGLLSQLNERITREIRKKYYDHKRELDFSYMDLKEMCEDVYALLDSWKEATNPEKNIAVILKDARENNGEVYFDKYSEEHILPVIQLRRDTIYNLMSFVNLMSHHAIFLYFLEDFTNDDIVNFTTRYEINAQGDVVVKE